MLTCIWKRVTGWVVAIWQRLFHCENGETDAPSGNRQLLDHFLAQLRDDCLYARSPSAGETAVANDPISGRIAELFKECDDQANATDDGNIWRRWERAYDIERLLVYVRPRSQLAIETDRRVDEVKRVGLPTADKYRAQLDAVNLRVTTATAAQNLGANALAATDADRARLQAAADQAKKHADDENLNADRDRRAILSAVLDDLQWQYQKNNLVRSALWDSASNLLTFGYVTSFFVAFPFICFVLERWSHIHVFSDLLDKFPNYGLYTAMSFGLLGAFFSRLTSLKFTTVGLTLEDAQNRYSYSSLLIRGAVGMAGAVLFYFLMRSGVIAGLSPNFENFAFEPLPDTWTVLKQADVLLPSKDWSLLVLYSFVAGFSEQLVPDTLSKVEAQVSGKKP